MTSMASRAPLAALAAVLTLCLLAPAPALAYIDPNSGGLLFQLLFPVLAAIAGFGTMVKAWIKARWVSLRKSAKMIDEVSRPSGDE